MEGRRNKEESVPKAAFTETHLYGVIVGMVDYFNKKI